ncbi:A24 family peptidase [Paenibacillus sp. CC-CFT747]|nr:A24 family peptidase [Paenibacillus sp. CC-CFT747]
MHLVTWVSLAAVLAVAVITDLKEKKIYDWLTIPSFVYFGILHLVFDRWSGLIGSIVGAALLFGLSLLLAALSKGQLGGGDIKLFSVIGAALGAPDGLLTMLLTFLAAGMAAWPILLVQRVRRNKDKKMTELALAPFMALGTGIVLLLLN